MNNKRSYNTGFTLIELMVVIFIIGILSAVAIPLMRGRTDSAKWSEGKSAAGTIRTAIRACIAERGNTYDFATNITTLEQLGFAAGDLTGRYFVADDYDFTITNSVSNAVLPTFTIRVDSSKTGESPLTPSSIVLTGDGVFTEIP